jgi:uncharacterized protein YceK
MKNTLVVLSILLCLALSGCSSKQMYESTQPKYSVAECRKLPQTQYQECIAREPMTYDQYQIERGETANKDN